MLQKILVYIILLFSTMNLKANELTINVSGVDIDQGRIIIGVFDNSKAFPYGTPLKVIILTSEIEQLTSTSNITDGEYAIAVFQDQNNNDKFDKNFLGIPKEKYGFSGIQTLTEPSFKEASVHIKANKVLLIHLK